MNKAEPTIAQAPRLGEMGLENFAPYLMNRIIGRYNAALSSEMAEMGLTTPQMRSLAVLSVMDGLLIRELAVYAVVQQSTLSRALETLDQNGMIRRAPDEQDSRATRVFITDAGREAYIRLWPQMSDASEAMFKGISEEQRRAFVGTLQTMLRNIRKHDF
ncbi:Transcriptional regulator, MarR family [Sulfitobacter noctilucae]|uniref:MarR family winged helix-turn-helix transcriptional regulator n=1 Tax=Sulfitobacter noctilucae TaxID=1342302 RepID=UPI00046A944C|nr:MarR family winged helix-turn-helix transcriptional regulator [Sulfitobacter noctilucae]KIN60121.1 Transcriptional regulator, MarR family [Sulfitobacter noctilucae]